MSTPGNQRVAPNRVALILALLLGVWLAFEFYPRKKPAPPMIPVMAESKLHIVGLADNPDWDGLPDIFAVCAGHAEWKDGRTRFAYWHPVMKTYSYYFEATRDGTGIRFKEIAEPHDLDYLWDESLGEDCPIRFYHSASLSAPSMPVLRPFTARGGDLPILEEKATRPDSVKIPPLELRLQPPDIEKKR